MAIIGLRDTSNFVTDQRPKNWREGILLLEPNGMAPLTGLTSVMKSRSVDDAEFNWWEKTHDKRRYQLHATSGDLTTSNTTITLASTEKGKSLKAGDLLYVEESGEIIQVAVDPSSDTSLTVTRGYAGSTKTAVDANGAGVNPYMTCIGSAYEEGSKAPTGVAYDPTKRTNYTQIFRNSLEATRTAIKTRLRTGDAVKEAKREALIYHTISMELAFWLGKKHEGTKNGKPVRTCDGIYQYVNTNASSNVVTAGATTDMATFEEYLYNAFQYGSTEKMAWVGNRSLLTIQQIIRKNSSFQIVTGEKEFGMRVLRFITPYGELVLKSHPLFNQMTGGTTGTGTYYGLESWMWILDMASFSYVYLKDSDTKYKPDIQDNDLDGMKSEYLTECSIEIAHAQSQYIIKGLRGAAADS